MEIALDTNAYSDWVRYGRWTEVISSAEWVGIPAVVLGELYAGFHAGGRFSENDRFLKKILAMPTVGVPEFNAETSLIFGKFVAYLKARGTPIPTNDIWIAACCYQKGLTLVTSDSHFQRLPQILLHTGEF